MNDIIIDILLSMVIGLSVAVVLSAAALLLWGMLTCGNRSDS